MLAGRRFFGISRCAKMHHSFLIIFVLLQYVLTFHCLSNALVGSTTPTDCFLNSSRKLSLST